MSQHEQVGFIGLGNLGRPIAKNLLDAGIDVTIYNRTRSKAESLIKLGAKDAAMPRDTVRPGGVIISILWDAQSVEDVVRSEGFLEQLGENGLHISMSTIGPESACSLAALHEKFGSNMISAPIFGRPEAATAKQLLFALSGNADGKRRAAPVLEAAGAKDIYDFGADVGAALTVKISGNFLILNAASALKEALETAAAHGVDKASLANMLTTTLFPAPIYRNYSEMIIRDASHIMDSPIGGKDIALFRDLAQTAGLDTAVADAMWLTRKA